MDINAIKEDKSYGVIPFFKDQNSEIFICLVYSNKGHWGFPKGHADPGETEEIAAIRELKEETGITDINLINNISFTEKFYLEKKGVPYNKTVVYFLGRTNSIENTIPDDFKNEIPELKWVTYKQAIELLTFPERKLILEDAYKFLNNHNEGKI